MINVDDAFGLEPFGVAFRDEDGTVIYYLTGGSDDPTGTDAPVPTFYLQSGGKIWQKFGVGVNDWRIYPAKDISFDSTGLLSTADNVQDAISQSLSQTFGLDFSEVYKSNTETTTGNSFTTYATLNFDVTDTEDNNKYRLNADFFWGHNATSNDIRVRTQLDGNTLKELRIEPKDAGNDQHIQNNLLIHVDDLSEGSHTLTLQYRPSTSSRTSSMYESQLEVWRVE